MDDLEPWNMFTNNFISDDDPNELLADATSIINEEYQKRGQEMEEISAETERAIVSTNIVYNEVEAEADAIHASSMINNEQPPLSIADCSIQHDMDGILTKIKDEPPDLSYEDEPMADINGDDTVNCNSLGANNFLVPDMSMNIENDHFNINRGMDASYKNSSNNLTIAEDDSAIFDFELTPMKTPNPPSERVRSSSRLSSASASSVTPDASNLDYEYAVLYICPSCGEEFDVQDKWKRHLNSVHEFNTKRGLNFTRIDKLYHECLECHKRIAMHSMENLLKHKYTHLPFRCSKCRFCLRQYKYRQDLMVHLRTQHIHDLVQVTKMHNTAPDFKNDNGMGAASSSMQNSPNSSSNKNLTIKRVHEKAFDLFDNNFDNVQVKNEVLDPDDNDIMDDSSYLINQQHNSNDNKFNLPTFLDDNNLQNTSTSFRRSESPPAKLLMSHEGGSSDNCEQHIQFICPQCGMEYGNQVQWRQHIEIRHEFNTRKGLNFREINNGQHSVCLECDKVLYVNNIPCLQLHKFTHTPRAAWLRCKICFRTFSGHKDISKHFKQQHNMGYGLDSNPIPKGYKSSSKTLTTTDPRNSPTPKKYKTDESLDSYDDSSFLDPNTSGKTSPTLFKEVPGDKNEKYIDYLCPACGKDLEVKKDWRDHISRVHGLTDLNTLKFKQVNERELMCLDCKKIITSAYGIQNAQQHYFTHLPYKAFLRCRICDKAYGDRKGLVKHLKAKHLNPDGSLKAYLKMKFLQEAQRRSKQKDSPQQGRHDLLAQALQRPMPGSSSSSSFNARATPPPLTPITRSKPSFEAQNEQHQTQSEEFAPKSKNKRVKEPPYVEVVEYGEYRYEITYLDDDDIEEDNGETQDSLTNPKPSTSSHCNGNNMTRKERCPDCGSIFRTRSELREHIKREHDFDDYNKQSYNENGSNDPFFDLGSRAEDDELSLLRPQAESPKTNPLSSSNNGSNQDSLFTFLCPACGIEFHTQVDWRRHINEVHHFDNRHFINFRQVDKFRFQCTICQDILSTSKLKTLQDHKFRHLPYKSFLKCKLCGVGYNHKPNIYAHLRIRHNVADPKDPHNNSINSEFKSEAGKKRSFPVMQSFSRPTPMPTKKSVSQNSFNGNSSFIKPTFSKSAEDNASFHNAVDHETITYFCPACNENFDSHVYWRRHIVEVHNLNSREGLNFRQIDEHHYLCLQCYKRVTVTHTKGAIGQLQSHKFRHLPYRSFKCLQCNGEFVRKQMFFKHLDRITKRCMGTKPQTAGDEQNEETDGASSSRSSSVLGNNHKKKPINQKLAIDSSNNSNADSSDTTFQNKDSSLGPNQDAFLLICPKCGIEFESQRTWREHINIEHQMNRRDVLNFKRINPVLHRCLTCSEHVHGRKLRDLQVHSFKHMKFNPYIKCRYCDSRYNYLRNIQDHLKLKHSDILSGVLESSSQVDEDDLSARIVEALHEDIMVPENSVLEETTNMSNRTPDYNEKEPSIDDTANSRNSPDNNEDNNVNSEDNTNDNACSQDNTDGNDDDDAAEQGGNISGRNKKVSKSRKRDTDDSDGADEDDDDDNNDDDDDDDVDNDDDGNDEDDNDDGDNDGSDDDDDDDDDVDYESKAKVRMEDCDEDDEQYSID